jgi:hypothetical protein
MPNLRPKGIEYMRELGRRGGLRSGETRNLKRVARIAGIVQPATEAERHVVAACDVWETTGRRFSLEQILEEMRPVDYRGGSHGTDWRCPKCRRFNTFKRGSCAVCSVVPMNGRLTRAELRECAEEHRLMAILRKHRV